MGGILFIAIGLAALTNATELGASALGTLLQGSLLVAILGAVLRRGRRQAFWIGFVVCGGGYALLAFDLSPTPSTHRPPFVTVLLLTIMWRYLADGSTGLTTALSAVTSATPAGTGGWEVFSQTGHALSGLIIAVLGGLLGRVLADRSP
jgi:hypothetical protein